MDNGEPKVKGLKFIVTGGFREENKRDTTMIVRGLEAYNSYLLTIDKNSFDEIAWKIKTSTLKVEIVPNQFRLIEIPVTVLGEVSGNIYILTENGKKAQDRILINIYNSKGVMVAQTLSEAEGYFTYLGLMPGAYTIKPDPEQMHKLMLQYLPDSNHFQIKTTYSGDVQRGIDFVLQPQRIKTDG